MKGFSPRKLFLLTFLGLVLVGCDQMPFVSTSGRYPGSSMPPSTACYVLESGVTITVSDNDLLDESCKSTVGGPVGGKTYARIRQGVKIVESKIQEGLSSSPTCASGRSKLRKIGELGGQDIYWEDTNYKGNDLSDFIFLFKEVKEGYYYFDVYIDQAKEIPEFIKNCEERGGLIPVIEGFTLPPQVFGLEEWGDDIPGDFDTDCSNYTCLLVGDRTDYFEIKKTELKPYYVKIIDDGSFPTGIGPGQEGLIGTLAATGTEEEKIYNVYYHADTMYLREVNNQGVEAGQIYVYNPTEGIPPKPAGRQPSLQLKALKFISTAEWTWATPECKPVIYLYPEKEINLSIKLDPDGYLTETEPLCEDGWEGVIAHPDGRLIYQGEGFDSLHYEAMITKFRTPQQGWVVKKEDLPGFFDRILVELGLSQKETEDFREYWLGRLTASPYFFVGLLSPEEIERIEPIEFSVEPKTFVRVRFYFKDLEKPFVVEPPTLPLPPARSGFTAVEWGGLYQEP